MTLDTATKQALSNPKTRRAAVKYQLDLMGLNMSDVARDAGVIRNCMYQVFNVGYPRMEAILAGYFGMTAQEMFPERHRPDGTRRRKKCGPKPKKKPNPKHIKNKPRRNVDDSGSNGHREAA